MQQSDGFKYFNWTEFDCKHTGLNEMDPEFIHKLDDLREACGFPFVITSGFRDLSHPIEAAKPRPGTHAQGIAADIKIQTSAQRYTLVETAIDMGFSGIGIAKSFIHIDDRKTTPVIWLY